MTGAKDSDCLAAFEECGHLCLTVFQVQVLTGVSILGVRAALGRLVDAGLLSLSTEGGMHVYHYILQSALTQEE